MKEKGEVDIYDRAPGHVRFGYNNDVLWFWTDAYQLFDTKSIDRPSVRRNAILH